MRDKDRETERRMEKSKGERDKDREEQPRREERQRKRDSTIGLRHKGGRQRQMTTGEWRRAEVKVEVEG